MGCNPTVFCKQRKNAGLLKPASDAICSIDQGLAVELRHRGYEVTSRSRHRGIDRCPRAISRTYASGATESLPCTPNFPIQLATKPLVFAASTKSLSQA